MGLIKRYMESRVLELLGKMEIGPFAFGLRYGSCLAVSEQRSSLFLTAERIAIFLVDISFVSMLFDAFCMY